MIERAKYLMFLMGQDLETNKILNIKDVKIPNFYLLTPFKWEFCHQLVELYENYILGSYFMYENNKVQINAGDVVFDCGANMGLFSAYAASKGAIVHAFEPNPLLKPCLQSIQYLYPKMEIHSVGCYSHNDIIDYNECDNIGANHLSQYQHSNLVINKIKVPVIALNNLGIIPNFIKMDVEGAEQDVLYGASDLLAHKPKMAISCYHANNDLLSLKSYIFENNQDYNFILYQNKLIFAY